MTKLTLCAALLLLLVMAVPAAAQATPSYLGNLRALRTPSSDFEWEGDAAIRVASSASAPRTVPGYYAAEFDVQSVIVARAGWRIVSVNAGRAVTSIHHGGAGVDARREQMRVRVPTICDASSERRTFVTLRVNVVRGEETRELTVPIDHECLVGDLGLDRAPRAGPAQDDDAIEQILSGLPRRAHRLPLSELGPLLLARLAELGASYRPDPVVPSGWIEASAYVLRPSETLRYGGDCEDWALLFAAVLNRLGFRAGVVDVGTHAFVSVETSQGRYSFDIDLPAGVTEQPLSLAVPTRLS